MKLNDAFPSKYIKAADLQDQNVPVVISHYAIEEVGDSDRKLVLYFQNMTKGMICNKTNAERIGLLYGDDLDEWAGREIVLTSELTQYNGKAIMGLRVQAPQRRSAPADKLTQRNGYALHESPQAPLPKQTQPDGLEEQLGPRPPVRF